MKVTKAIFPVAGLGTRFLPATKASPKEMLSVVDKPLIQYAVEEAVAAGITELIFITSSNKRAIEDHFDRNLELERFLQEKNKTDLLKLVENILPAGVTCVYIRQPEQLGLGHAIACAAPLIYNEPFAVLLADDLIVGEKPCLKDMVEHHERIKSSVIAVQAINATETDKYGVVALDHNDLHKPLIGIVEKPNSASAPSNLGVVGRYILTPAIFNELAHTSYGAGGEIQLTDAIARLLTSEPVYAHAIKGVRYDCGSKIGFLKATVALGLTHDEVKADFTHYLRDVVKG